MNSPHKWPVTREMFPFDDVIMRADDVAIIRHELQTLCGILPNIQQFLPSSWQGIVGTAGAITISGVLSYHVPIHGHVAYYPVCVSMLMV